MGLKAGWVADLVVGWVKVGSRSDSWVGLVGMCLNTSVLTWLWLIEWAG